jgi:hypothetical protein
MPAPGGAPGRAPARNGCRVLPVRTLTSALSLLLAMTLVLASVRGSADALDGILEVRSAYVEVDHSVFQLHARIEYPMNPQILDALRDGVTLAFDLDTRVMRVRRLWFDATVVELTFHRELAYHTVTDRYVVREDRTGDQQSFPTLDDALRFLGTVDNMPILVEAQLASGERYRVSVRAGVRRGRLPASLRALLFWTDDWHRVSPWYTWSLPS